MGEGTDSGTRGWGVVNAASSFVSSSMSGAPNSVFSAAGCVAGSVNVRVGTYGAAAPTASCWPSTSARSVRRTVPATVPAASEIAALTTDDTTPGWLSASALPANDGAAAMSVLPLCRLSRPPEYPRNERDTARSAAACKTSESVCPTRSIVDPAPLPAEPYVNDVPGSGPIRQENVSWLGWMSRPSRTNSPAELKM